MEKASTLLLVAFAIGLLIFFVIALPKILGNEKRETDNKKQAQLIVLQPSLPANEIPQPPEVKPHEHLLGPGGTQWIYN